MNNAGVNIVERHWDKLTPESIDTLLQGNLSGALYCVTVALPFMRASRTAADPHRLWLADSSVASAANLTVAKHGIVAMSQGSTCRNA